MILDDAARAPQPARPALTALPGFPNLRKTLRNQILSRLLPIASAAALLCQCAGSSPPVEEEIPSAEGYYQRALEKDPLLAGAHAGLGSLLESTGRLEEAERRYRRALEINPDLLSAQQLLAELLLRRGDAEEAADLLRRSVTTNPTDALLRRNLAQALQRLGKEKEAEAELEKARQIEAWKSPQTK